MHTPLWMWAGFLAIVLVLLAFDLGIFNRKRHVIEVKEALRRSAAYFALAMCFNLFVFENMGKQAGYEFFMGYLIELSLSLDNLFVFLLIFGHFKVPREYQSRVLLWGIIGAVVMRGVMIGLGTTLIREFAWITYIFGAFLVLTGIKILISVDAEPDVANNSIVKFMRSRFRMTDGFEGDRFFVRRAGKLLMTPLFMVLILIEVSDLIFAVDSIPAIFAVTNDSFIVLTSNIFAILGLRSLYFALAAFMHRFEYLKYGLSVILVFIGTKMLVNHYFNEKIISTELSLAVIVSVIGLSVVISLAKTRGDKAAIVRTGWVPGSDSKKPRKKKKKESKD